MPVESGWSNDTKTIMHIRFLGEWNWDEFYPAQKEAHDLVMQIEHNYFVALDFTDNPQRLPPSIISHFRKAAENAPAHRKGVVIVSNRLFLVRALVNTGTRVLKMNYRLSMAATFEEAEAIVAKELEKINA
jgi:hypothetical protein